MKVHNPNNLPTIPIADLLPTQGNLKDLTEKNYSKLKGRIEHRGFSVPVYVWEDDKGVKHLLDGHQRRQVLTTEGWNDPIPYLKIPAKDLQEAMARLLEITSQYATITQEGIDEFMATYELNEAEVYEATSFDALGSYGSEEEPEIEEDEAPEVDESEPPKSKLGEVYQLGRHRVMCADSTVKENVEKLMDGNKADMVFTDPPYGISKDGIANDELQGDDFYTFSKDYISIAPVKDNCGMVCYHSTRTFYHTLNAFVDSGWKFEKMLFFYRPDKMPVHTWNGWMMTSQAIMLFSIGTPEYSKVKPAHQDVYKITSSDLSEKSVSHPTVKPIKNIVDLLSHYDASIIYEPFLGSGSTLIACEQTDRTCYGMELDPKYVDVIRKRYAKFTNNNELPDNWEELTKALE